MLSLLDFFLTFLHLVIIGFNLFGWIPYRTRKAHFISVLITAGSWFVLGIWYGIGYCPITDWQWQVKEKLGESHLPASFVTYYADKLSGSHFSPSFINTVTAASFALAVIASVYVNFFQRKKNRGMYDGKTI